jgi:hypothetical protein
MFNLNHFILFLFINLILYLYLKKNIKSKIENIYISSIFFGLYFYGGIGASLINISIDYSIYFLIFIITFIFSYKYFGYIESHILSFLPIYNSKTKISIINKKLYSKIIYFYFAILIMSLIYPEFKLKNLFLPPTPNSKDFFEQTLGYGYVDILSKLIYYFILLITPFFYYSLQKYKKNPTILFIIIFLNLYIQYCASEYIGRGIILMNLIFFLICVYYFNLNYRKFIIMFILVAFPIISEFFYIYSIRRLGYDIPYSFSFKDVGSVIYSEISIPENFDIVLKSGYHIDFINFLKWLILLPVPKIFIGNIDLPVINYEIAEILINVPKFSSSYFVKLSGFVAESVYVFGRYFFWVEAIILGIITKVIFIILDNINESEFLTIYFGIYWAFMFSRAGIGAVLPFFMNAMILFYIVFLIRILMGKRWR